MKKFFLAFIVLAALFSSCSVHERSSSSGWAHNVRMEDGSDKKAAERIVIYNAYLTMVVRNADSTNARLARVAAKYNGYVLAMGNEQSVIRVQASLLNDAMRDICAGGKLKKKSITGQDVTEDYQDSKIRLDNAYKARQRYLELLAKAENVEAALKVEVELERLNKEIDLLEGRIKRLQHLSEYSTITVKLEKKVKPGILGYVFVGIYKGVKWLFVRN